MVMSILHLRSANAVLKTAAAAIPIAYAGAAFAQSPAADPGLRIEEVVVSARKREERLLDTPIAVTALGASAIELRQMQSAADIGNYAPNVQFDAAASESGGGSSSQISIRGIGQTDYAITVEPGVGLYLDGVYIGKSVGSLMDTVDLEQIEVLRGPQGTLFGKNTIGGAIVLTSQRPSHEQEFGVAVTTGRYERIDIKGHVNLPLNDSLRMRVSGASLERDGYMDRVLDGGTQGDRDAKSARLVTEWDISPALMATFIADGTRTREKSPAQVILDIDENAFFASLHNSMLYPACDPSLPGNIARFSNTDCVNRQYIGSLDQLETTNTGPNQSDSDIWGLSMTLDWSLNELDIKSITAYRHAAVDVMQELAGIPTYQTTIMQDISLKQFTQELQVSGTALNKRLTYLTGLFYMNDRGTQEFPVLLEPVEFISGGKVDNDSYAIFTQLTYDVLDNSALTLGARYSREDKRYQPQQVISHVPAFYQPFWDVLAAVTGNQFLVQEGLPLFPSIWVDDRHEEFTPSVTFDHHFSPDMLAYISYAKGFKGGGFTMRGFPPVIPGVTTSETDPSALIPGFEPETAEVYEIGFKGEFLNNRLRTSLAAFTTDYDDLQLTANSGFSSFVPVMINGGKARIQGAELEAELQATTWLNVNAAIGYLDSEYRSLSDEAIVAGASLDNELPNAPRWSATLGATMDIMNNDHGHVFLRADLSHKDDQYKTVGNDQSLYQEAYTTYNAYLTWELPGGNWKATVGGSNLSDERYIVSGVANAGIGYSQAIVSRPREWMLAIAYDY